MATNSRGDYPFRSTWWANRENHLQARSRPWLLYDRIDFANKSLRSPVDVVFNDFMFPVPPPVVEFQKDQRQPIRWRRLGEFADAWGPQVIGPFPAPIVLLQEDLRFPIRWRRQQEFADAWGPRALGPFPAPIVLLQDDLRLPVPRKPVRHIDNWWDINIVAHGYSFGYILY